MKKIMYLIVIFILSFFLTSCSTKDYSGEYEGYCICEHMTLSAYIPTIDLSINNKQISSNNQLIGDFQDITFEDEIYDKINYLRITEGYDEIVENIKSVKSALFYEIGKEGAVTKARYYLINYNKKLYFLIGSLNEDNYYTLMRCYELTKK